MDWSAFLVILVFYTIYSQTDKSTRHEGKRVSGRVVHTRPGPHQQPRLPGQALLGVGGGVRLPGGGGAGAAGLGGLGRQPRVHHHPDTAHRTVQVQS